MVDIVFANPEEPIVARPAIIHDNEAFSVQWTAFNASGQELAFSDRLVVSNIPEGCPGTDDGDHEIVFDSEFAEDALPGGAVGGLMQASVGPFPVGSYRLTVTLANDLGVGVTTFRCIDVVQAT